MTKKKNFHWSLWKEGLAFIVAVLLVYKIITNVAPIMAEFRHFLSVLSPFIIGTVIAYFFSRPADRVEEGFKKTKVPFLVKRARGFSVLTVFLGAIALITVIVSYGIPIIISNLVDFANQIVVFYDVLMLFIYNMDPNSWIAEFISSDLILTITEALSFQTIIMQLGNSAISIVEYLISMTSGIITAVISLIICLYMLVFKESVLGLLNRIAKVFIKEQPLKAIKSYIHKSNDIFYQFIAAQFLDACILGTLATIMLAIIGVEYAVTLGLLLGICNMIPYFGSMFASFLTGIITLFTGGFQLAIITGVCLLILQQIDGNFIGPRIMGDKLNLNPMLIIVSITVGGAYFGIIGMFVSVPVAAMLKMFLDDFLTIKEKKIALAKTINLEETAT